MFIDAEAMYVYAHGINTMWDDSSGVESGGKRGTFWYKRKNGNLCSVLCTHSRKLIIAELRQSVSVEPVLSPWGSLPPGQAIRGLGYGVSVPLRWRLRVEEKRQLTCLDHISCCLCLSPLAEKFSPC